MEPDGPRSHGCRADLIEGARRYSEAGIRLDSRKPRGLLSSLPKCTAGISPSSIRAWLLIPPRAAWACSFPIFAAFTGKNLCCRRRGNARHGGGLNSLPEGQVDDEPGFHSAAPPSQRLARTIPGLISSVCTSTFPQRIRAHARQDRLLRRRRHRRTGKHNA
jgi:hypothetical protein